MTGSTLANTTRLIISHQTAASTQPCLLPFNMGITRPLLALIVLIHDLSTFTSCSSHNPTVVCNHNNRACTVHNAYGTWSDRTTCHATAVVYPSSEIELLHAVAMASQKGQPMKVVTSTGHSMPKWACPRGHGGLLISTKNYTRNVVVDQSSMRVTADSGVQLRTLLDTIAKAGLALPYSPYWEGVTLGGLLSTGSHGSSLFGKGSAVHDHVVAMRLVVPAPEEEGYAKIITLTQHDEWLSAAKVSLGVLGVISQVSLQLEPQFKRRVSKEWRWDGALEGEILGFGKAHEFGDLTWFPAQHKLLLSIDDRVPLETPGESINAFHGFRPRPPLLFKASRAIEEAAEALLSSTTKCLVSVMQTEMVHGRGAGLTNSKKGFTKFPVIGFQHHMQTSGACAHSQDPNLLCPWDLGVQSFFYHETTFMIPLENISNFIVDVKKLRDMNPTSLCGLDLYVGILMRFLKKSSAYLGSQADAVAVDITYYRAPHANAPRLHEDVMEEIEQIALFKYGGLPHWGKNRPLAFQGVSSKYPQMPQFYAVRKAMDPDGLFSSEWSNAALGISGNTSGNEDYCALDGLCICDEDKHCAPERGYYCRRGKVYKEAKVCRLERAISWSNWLIIEGSFLHIQLNAWMQVCVRIVVRTILHLKAFASWVVQVPPSLF